MGKRGPKPKPDEEQPLTRTYRCPRELVADVEKYIPEGERSGIILACLRAEVKRRKRLTQDSPGPSPNASGSAR